MERISKFFPMRIDPISKRFEVQKRNRNSGKLSPFVKIEADVPRVSILLKLVLDHNHLSIKARIHLIIW